MSEKTEVQVSAAKEPVKSKFKTVGLKDAEYMPVSFGGTIYDLKNLSEEDGDMLIAAKYPHLIKS
jgi:hypothetical protein